MGDYNWERIETIIDEALSLPEEQRLAFIDQKCDGNPELKSEVTILLNSISDSEGWLENPARYKEEFYKEIHTKEASLKPGSSLRGKKIGPYQIKELLGQGGMGLVFMAERTDGTFEHKVALKIMREGMDTAHNLRRFRQERNILAGLDHPNIAGILDGGVTDQGLPYLIMDYVDGVPIDDYCQKHMCTIDERIDLIKTICQAVQHAHNNLIIHRDLKPGNILVDEEGRIRVLDFGIAKLLDANISDETYIRTQTGARMLTISYAAPEQVTGAPLTTGVDNYALGTLMYRLLTGVLPFDKEGKSVSQMEEMISRVIPPKPSERFKALSTEQQQQISRQMQSSPARVVQMLKGDLDAIILKNLRKESSGRYGSPEQLLEDLQRFEDGLPVSAREGTVRYHMTKFTKRHGMGIAVSVISLIAMLGFGLFYTHQITQERNKAQIEAKKAEQVTAFITDLFSRSNPYFDEGEGGLDIKIGSILRYGASRIDTELEDQPEVRAELKKVIGEVYSNVGEFGTAESLLTEALRLREQLYAEPRKETAENLRSLAFLYQEQAKFDEAETLLQKAIHIFENSEQGLQNESAISAMARFGNLLWFNKGDYEAADSVLTRTLELRQEVHTGDHVHIAINLNDLATLYHAQGSYAKAEPYYANSINMYKRLYGEHTNVAIIMSNFSALLREQGKYYQAEQYQREALKMHRDLTGKESVDVALGMGSLGHILLEQQRYTEADSLFSIALVRLKEIYGNQHPYIARTNLNRGKLYLRQKEFTKAEPIFLKAQKDYQLVYPEKHPRTSDPLLSLGLLYLELDQPDKAKPFLEQANTIRIEGYPSDSWRIAQTMSALGLCLSALGEFSKADSLLVKSYNRMVQARGITDSYTKRALERLVLHYRQWQKPEEAKRYSELNSS